MGMHVGVVVMGVVQHGHALQGTVQTEADERGPWQTAPGEFMPALFVVRVPVHVAVLNPLAEVFQQALNEEAHQHKHTGIPTNSIGFGDQVQETHADDEGAPKRQKQPKIVHATLAQQHEQQAT